jgi:3'(2'), 5'-bisphosphate nucleotidase
MDDHELARRAVLDASEQLLDDATPAGVIAGTLRAYRPDDALLGDHLDEPRSRHRVWLVDAPDDLEAASMGVALSEHGEITAEDGGPVRIRSIGVDRDPPPRCAERLARVTGARLVRYPSNAISAVCVVLGEADAHVQDGSEAAWRTAAAVSIAHVVGLHVSRLDGSPPRYDTSGDHIPDLLICRPELAAIVLAGLTA